MKKILLMFVPLFMFFVFYGVLYSVAYADLTDGLVAYYPFNGNASDQSGNGNDGDEYGGIQYKQGIIGDSASFDGVDDYIRVPSNSSLNPVDQLSISFWVKVDGITNVWSPIVHKGGPQLGGLANREYTVWLQNNFDFHTASAGDGSSQNYSNACCAGLGWTHYLGIIDRQNHRMKIYVDGILKVDANDPYSTFNNNNYDLIFGGTEEISNYYSPFKGRLDEVRIYNRVLTEEEINTLSDEYSTLHFEYQAPTVPSLGEHLGAVVWVGPAPQVNELIENDLGYPAWSISGLGLSSQFAYLSGALSAKEKARITNEGFTLTLRGRVLQGNAPAYDAGNKTIIGAATLDIGSRRYDIALGINSSGNAVAVLLTDVDVSGPGGSVRGFGPSYTLDDAGYHTYELIFNPQTQSASLFIDGTERISGYTGRTQHVLNWGLSFGAASGGGMNFNLVQLTSPVVPSSDLFGECLQALPTYEFSLDQDTQKNVSLQLFNSSDQQQSATLEIINPHSDLSVSLTQQNSITLAPGETVDIPIVIDASSTPVDVYDGILLEVAVDGCSTLYSNITVYVTEGTPDLPDLTVSSNDINTDSGDPITYVATIHNRGNSPASDVKVRFYDFGDQIGEISIPEVPANESTNASITIPAPPSGDRLVEVVIDPLETIPELNENNNNASRIVQPGGPSGPTEGHIIVTGNLPQQQVCAHSLFTISGHAFYDITVNGIRNTEYVVKGGSVQIMADWPTLYGDIHTDVNGNFTRSLFAPESPGSYSVTMTVTDNTFRGTGKVDFEVVECPTGSYQPVCPPNCPPNPDPTDPPHGEWVFNAIKGLWEWICSGDNCPPVPKQDVFIYSENIVFSPNRPEPNDVVIIGAQIQYFATPTNLLSGEVQVNFYVTSPGSPKVKLPQTVKINSMGVGGSTAFATWKALTDGIYIVEVEAVTTELTENTLNNAATRAIVVGNSAPIDPNSKYGPLGIGTQRLVSSAEPLWYVISFENLESATDAAQKVVITDHLDTTTMDLSTFRFGPILFGDQQVNPFPRQHNFSTDVDLRPNNDLIVRVKGQLDSNSGLLTWHLQSIDPVTGEPTTDGFLPPNITPPEGEGSVNFTVMPKGSLSTGTEIRNSAAIVFDTNPPIETPVWLNTIEQVVTNLPPTANAGENLVIASAEQCSTVIQGTASDTDNDTLELEYRWLEGQTEILAWTSVGDSGDAYLDVCYASLGLGQHTLTLEVSDGQSKSSNSMILTIDNSAPNAAPSGGGAYRPGELITVGGQVSDFDGELLTYTWSEGTTTYCTGEAQSIESGEPVSLPECDLPDDLELGTHTVTLTVSDGTNEPVSRDITIEIVDATAPTLAPEPNIGILWPPNHKMVDITIDANASDNSGIPPTLSATVISNEPQEGLGDGDMTPDWMVIDQENGVITLQLRAERSGLGEGRTYTISITAIDDAGNSSSANVEIIVPHDQRNNN